MAIHAEKPAGPLAEEIAALLYRAGRTNASSVVLPGEGPIGFAEWVQQRLDADPARVLVQELLTELRKMVEVYWGKGDGQEPPPTCIVSACAVITKATEAV